MFGVILFNFALVLAIPAWLFEKKESVSVAKVVHTSTAIALALYIGVGIMGALAIPKVNVNMLTPMVSGAFGIGMQCAASVFAFFIIGLDVPLFSVLTRYNLTHSGLCSINFANWLVVWIPWGLAWLFYAGDSIAKVLDWGGVLFISVVAFLLPLYLALRALQQYPERKGSVAVYGPFFKSDQAQKVALWLLLLVASISVMIAVGGQIKASEDKYIHSEAYLNSTE